MAEYVELEIDQGTDFATYITINDDNTNLVQNVAGYVVTGQLRRSLLSPNVSETLHCTANVMTGEIAVTLAAANTANLKPGRYFYDIKVTSSPPSRLIEGIVIVSPAITK